VFNKFNFIEELTRITPVVRNNPKAKIYIFGMGEPLEFYRQMYKNLAGVELLDYVNAFVDEDKDKIGSEYYGKPIISLSQVEEESVVIACVYVNNHRVFFADAGIIPYHRYFHPVWLESILFRFCKREVSTFQNKHRGERCFVLGNAPSLELGDIEKIHASGEYTLASNMITALFDKTEWRPSYYFNFDPDCRPDTTALQKSDSICFFNIWGIVHAGGGFFDNAFYLQEAMPYFYHYDYPQKIKFSEEIDIIHNCGTIAHVMLQAAVNMGFTEIYLIGVNHEYPTYIDHAGNIVHTELKQSHFYDNDLLKVVPGLNHDVNELGYKSAREYADAHGIKIYNATRGGRLEAFERVDFDSIFEKRRRK
jgi:hypothetical protein